MYTVTILEKSKKVLRTYEHINKIICDDLTSELILEGDAILTHQYKFINYLFLFSEIGNYTILSDIIGTLEIESEI